MKLTAREQEIAIALTQGLRSSAVARDLGISIYTVRKHISSILRKYDVTSQCELIARIYGQSTGAGSGSRAERSSRRLTRLGASGESRHRPRAKASKQTFGRDTGFSWA